MNVSLIPVQYVPAEIKCREEGPLAPIYDELLKIILSSRQLYSPPLIFKKDTKDVRAVIHAIMVVSKRWNATMRELIVPLLNNNTIDWSYLPAVNNLKAPKSPIYQFLAQPNRARLVTRLDLSRIGTMNGDRLGEIVRLCANVQALFISSCTFDLNHLTTLPNLKLFDISCSTPLNVSVLGERPSLEIMRIKKCYGNPYWTHLNSSTSLKSLLIHSRSNHYIQEVPASLTSLNLFSTYFTADDPFQSLIRLKHLSFSVIEDTFPPLKNLPALESLEIASGHLPDGYLEDVLQIKRLKVSFSQNLPDLKPFTNLTQLFLCKVDNPQIRFLENLTELKMVNCTFNWMTFTGMKSLKKLTLNNWKKTPEEVSFHQAPNLESLTIHSNRIVNIYARSLTKLDYLKINCGELKCLTLPVDIGRTAEIKITQKVKNSFREEAVEGLGSVVFLF